MRAQTPISAGAGGHRQPELAALQSSRVPRWSPHDVCAAYPNFEAFSLC